MSLRSELQNLAPSAIIELFVLDATALGASLLYFHAGTNELQQNVVWQGVPYIRYPVEATGFDIKGDGSLPRPHLKVSNALSAISALLLVYGDLLGARVIRKRTLAKFLDSQNFKNGNPSADPAAAFPDDIFVIDRKVSENRQAVEFELTTSFDLVGVQIPRRQVVANVCVWKYRGAECSYTGTKYFDATDQPVADRAQDVCGKRLNSCRCRFGQTAELPYGGFPGAVLS
ncbi:MAG: phage minor tail protein L [Lysobacteraceae bacterium]|nr:MAG: phage minor tail protein L [Xanthomonadaceae bacterium]